jgi:tRNA-specific 2-thiouridylase
MSGGVDSSVAAVLLRRQGYEVIGLFMRTGVLGQEGDRRHGHKQGCCSALDAGDARRVADQLDLPFYALDFADDFRRVMDVFADEYLAGRTPNPCVLCNSWLKFGKLWSYSRSLDADFIATGHYAQVRDGPDGPALLRGTDSVKDQTYVLFGLRRSLLPRLLFPVGGYPKEAVREIARREGLPVAAKPESQEICFVPDGDHAAFVRGHRPGRSVPGVIRDTESRAIGTHDGVEHFTVGQRKGLHVAAASRRYVLDIIPSEATVVVAPRQACLSSGLLAERCNWLVPEPNGRSPAK